MDKIYTAHCHVYRCVDGDTLDVELDMGWHIRMDVRVRLLGVDTPELKPRRDAFPTENLRLEHIRNAEEARQQAMDWCLTNERAAGKDPFPFVLHSMEVDSFGRTLGVLWYGDETLNSHMQALGHAVGGVRDAAGARLGDPHE